MLVNRRAPPRRMADQAPICDGTSSSSSETNNPPRRWLLSAGCCLACGVAFVMIVVLERGQRYSTVVFAIQTINTSGWIPHRNNANGFLSDSHLVGYHNHVRTTSGVAMAGESVCRTDVSFQFETLAFSFQRRNRQEQIGARPLEAEEMDEPAL